MSTCSMCSMCYYFYYCMEVNSNQFGVTCISHTCTPSPCTHSHIMHILMCTPHTCTPHTCTPHTCTPSPCTLSPCTLSPCTPSCDTSHMHTSHMHTSHMHTSHMHISHMYTSHMHTLTHAHPHIHTLTHAHPHTGTTLRLLPPKLVVTEGETVTFTCTPVSPYAYPILTMNNALVITHPRLKVSKKQYPVEYRIAGNFHESQTNTPGNKFCDFYFRDKVMISDHTRYNFPYGNGDPQRVFQHQNHSKKLACLSNRVSRCWRKTAMSKGGN